MARLALTVPEAAKTLGCSESHVRRAVKRGLLPVVHRELAGRRILIPATALEQAVADLTVTDREAS